VSLFLSFLLLVLVLFFESKHLRRFIVLVWVDRLLIMVLVHLMLYIHLRSIVLLTIDHLGISSILLSAFISLVFMSLEGWSLYVFTVIVSIAKSISLSVLHMHMATHHAIRPLRSVSGMSERLSFLNSLVYVG
jgi:hypothetical protein